MGRKVKLDYVVAQLGLNNLSSIRNCFATDYMLETVLFVYYLLFINTFYLYKPAIPFLHLRRLILLTHYPLLLLAHYLSSDSVNNVNNNSEFTNSLQTTPQVYSLYTKLNPWFVTGFTDAEGCFLINVRPNSNMKN